MQSDTSANQVQIIVGSESDLALYESSGVSKMLDEIGVTWTDAIISAHRNPSELSAYCVGRHLAGAKVFIGAASMAAALPGAIAAAVQGCVPVLGVALASPEFPNALDAILAMVRMPAGRPVACAGIDKAGWVNAALMACAIIGRFDSAVAERLKIYQVQNTKRPRYNVTPNSEKGS